VAVLSALTSVSEMKIPIEYLISVCFVLLLFFASSFFVFNVYAQQQGGAATGGGAQLNQGTGMTITCTVNNACIITGGSAIGGPATSGNAIGSGGSSQELQSQIHTNVSNNSNIIPKSNSLTTTNNDNDKTQSDNNDAQIAKDVQTQLNKQGIHIPLPFDQRDQ
jgi:hypothetical protein